ncbi:aminotransferase [Mesorhizobium sp. ANAO-SY3R2]|uniref:aminotransferase n=1 Tax=Mesorhizobium sp. ANAO-SY3R2 TaxID=3166644 RepID=UPI00366D7D53
MDTAISNSAGIRDIAYHLHSQSNPRHHEQQDPFVVVRGDGAYVFDNKGKRYIDAMAGLWCASLGFNDKRLAAAAARQYERLGFNHTFYSRTSDVTTDLAEKLVSMTGMRDGKTYFATSGSEANETMVKFAWMYHAARGNPRKRKVISRDKGFHGSSIVAASMCGLEAMHNNFGLPLDGFIKTLCPDGYRVRRRGEDDAAFVARLVDELEQLIVREGADTIAAFIAEPVIAGGGIIPPPAGYFEAVQMVLERHDILCLDDEIVCGFGRTGNWFGHETVGMRPDMMSMAKGLTASYFPMSAVVMSRKIYEVIADSGWLGHGFTYSGHPVGAAIALEAISIYEEMAIVEHVRRVGERLRSGLERIGAQSSIVGDVRGVGLMYGVELVADPVAGTPFDPALQVGQQFQALARENGLITRCMRDTVGFSPPLIIGDGEVDDMLERFSATLGAIEARVSK